MTFFDDRRYPFTLQLTPSTSDWNYLVWYCNAPSSTAFIEYNGERYSLQRAMQASLIWRSIWEWDSSIWHEYSNAAVTDLFFHASRQYAIWPFVNGAVLTIFVPGNHFQGDRAKIDMLHTVASDRRFTNVRTQTHTKNPSWWTDPNFDLHYMEFEYRSGNHTGITNIYQATSKTNPLERYMIYQDPDTIAVFTRMYGTWVWEAPARQGKLRWIPPYLLGNRSSQWIGWTGVNCNVLD